MTASLLLSLFLVGWMIRPAYGDNRAAVRAEASRVPFIAGGKETSARMQDAKTIQQLLAVRGSDAWFITVNRALFVALPQRNCVAYLRPEQPSARLRRGKFRVGRSLDGPNQARKWTLDPLSPDKQRYAQVALPKHPFEENLEKPSRLDQPFAVEGEVADADIVTLVDYFRSSPDNVELSLFPSESDATRGVEITGVGSADGKQSIVRMRRTTHDTIMVTTERRLGASQSLTFRRVDGRWIMTEVAEWCA